MSEADAPGVRPPAQIHITEIDQAIHEAPVIFVDGAQSLIVGDMGVRFNFYQDRLVSAISPMEEPTIRRVVCARMAMNIKTLVQLYDWLTPVVEQFRGLTESAEPSRDQQSGN